ncbi:hypothetical protein [Burkholderia sp. MSMB1498]|uniref:hypothetical protein n=1 Tax=Burkholderia sp. MSMB1498 TaxID=1637842 RepID=UPI0007542F2C|nr:hypothetical protein [Burkholderia sp. MSMB1498]KVK78728.1 hypothetical protein WS91_00360 [Burkholderia sp. MSMB1498]
MKLSILIAAACAAFALTALTPVAHAQTYHFGEGQTGMSGGAQATPTRHAVKTTHHHKQRRHHVRRAVRAPRTYAHH